MYADKRGLVRFSINRGVNCVSMMKYLLNESKSNESLGEKECLKTNGGRRKQKPVS